MTTAPRSTLGAFLHSEAASGALLIAASAAAMLYVNAVPGGAGSYHHLLDARIGPMTTHMWINDGLMAIFFLVVGLEIKRECVEGRLASAEQRRLPVIAAIAGMAAPALAYMLIARQETGLLRGWAIPAATDIAFAIGVLALLGKRVPAALTLLLATIAIVDDMGAILVIALGYSSGLNLWALGAAAAVLTAMVGMNRAGVRTTVPYLIGFALLWCAVLLSGVHATLAGVLAAMTVPVRGSDPSTVGKGALHRLERALHPWSAFLVVPVFGLANAGVALPPDIGAALLSPLPLAIAAGLFAGKQIGVFGAIRLSVAAGIADRPRGASWLQVYGVATLCGIGFTMSLFIGALAFPGDARLVEEAKMGVLAGSLLSALAGLLILRLAPRATEPEDAAR